ncbi:MAG: 5-bromo-4-chloroindolyl phosphate hydrolysis family protein, partial [Pseudomonadota bacterium]
MQLPEAARQIAAGIVAALVFLGLFFALQLVWWIALVGAVGVFAAALLIIERRPEATEEMVVDGVSRAELTGAINAITEASKRMREIALSASGDDKTEFQRMASLFEAIRGHHIKDPRDYRHTRRFIRHDLPRIVDTAERYVELNKKATGGNRDRVQSLGDRIRSFTPVLEKIDQACLENDFMALEVQVEVLGD